MHDYLDGTDMMTEEDQHSRDLDWLQILGLLTGAILYYLLMTAVVTTLICCLATEAIHGDMFRRILNARMSFFDTITTGQILNNFSRDMNLLDELLIPTILNLLVG